jgi:hypothetical protein
MRATRISIDHRAIEIAAAGPLAGGVLEVFVSIVAFFESPILSG